MKKVLLFTFLIFLSVVTTVDANTNSHSLDLERTLLQSAVIRDEDSSINFTSDFTIEAWINLESLPAPADNYSILTQWRESSRGFIYSYSNTNGVKKLRLKMQNAQNTSKFEKTISFNLIENRWYHVAVSYDASLGGAVFFVDGQDVGSVNGLPIGANDSTADILIGHDSNYGSGSSFDGKIDEIRIWNEVRTESQIRENMFSIINIGDSLQSSWSFNNNFGDSTSNRNQLSGKNGAQFSTDVPFSLLEQKYPLYTQIESPYPSEVETASWAGDIYANGFSSCGETVAQCGCVISSLVMSARNIGIETDVLGDAVNPGNINEYLRSVGGYTSFGAVNWLAASAYLGEYTSSGKLASRFASAPTRPTSEATTMSFIDSSLEVDTNAVLAYKGGHFLWLPEKTAGGYVVQDPWWYETETADDVDNNQLYVKDYNNQFTDARVIKIHDEPVEFSGTDIELHLTSATAELLFTNSLGEKVGYSGGIILIDLDNASYGNTEIVSLNGSTANGEAGKHLLVYKAGKEFMAEVVGIESGEFTLEFFTIDEFGKITTFEFSGVTLPGITTTFTFNLETGEVNESEISYEQFISLLEAELAGYSKQQQKFFLKWTDKIFADLDNKTISQALQSIETYKKLLVAKKVDSPVLSNLLDLLTEGI